MEDQLKQYLEEFVHTLKQGGEFALEQLPIFIHEYLMWGFWESVILSILLLLSSVCLFKISWYLGKRAYNYESSGIFDDGELPFIMGSAISGVLSVMSLLFAIPNILTAIKISVAPRVYLIENLMNLI